MSDAVKTDDPLSLFAWADQCEEQGDSRLARGLRRAVRASKRPGRFAVLSGQPFY